MKLKYSAVEKVRSNIMKIQENTCKLCGASFGPKGKKPALDHDHTTGCIRDVLCLHCNGMLGKVENAARRAVGKTGSPIWWLTEVAYYLTRHKTPQWNGHGTALVYPTHKTEEDKRLARLEKAKKKRRDAKALQKVK